MSLAIGFQVPFTTHLNFKNITLDFRVHSFLSRFSRPVVSFRRWKCYSKTKKKQSIRCGTFVSDRRVRKLARKMTSTTAPSHSASIVEETNGDDPMWDEYDDDMDDMDDEDDMDTGMGGSDSGLVRTGGYTSSPSLAFGLVAVSLVAAGATGLYASNR